MTTEQENRIIDKFIKLKFPNRTKLNRPNVNAWPDGIVRTNKGQIDLELTELIHPTDNIHTARKKIETSEDYLQDILEHEFFKIFNGIGALITISLDLDQKRLTNSKLIQIKDCIVNEAINIIDLQRIQRNKHTTKFDISKLTAAVEISTNPNWEQICCNVGYKGAHLQELTTAEIQIIINRKNKRQATSRNFHESWLLLIEGGDGSMRAKIHLNDTFETWYDGIFIVREFSGKIFQLERKTATNTA